MEYIIDKDGKWEVEGNSMALIEPSQSYLNNIELEKQEVKDKELIKSLIPSDKDVLMAEIEIKTITILQEVGLI